MKIFRVSFSKNGELFKTAVRANNANEARNYIANKYGIDTHTEFVRDGILIGDPDNSVGAVVEV